MLFRVIGGKKGIETYLQTGRKRGREQTRDQLDERVVLLGELSLVEHALGMSVKKGEKYLHLTISFLEDVIAPEVLREIGLETQRFLRAAYQDDELICYAEAHLPRIKSLPAKGTKKEVTRKPHIHFVVPQLNLLTGKSANPLGKVKTNIEYINALQETLNARLGLASPQDHRRLGFENGAVVIERHIDDGFTGAHRDLKQKILEAIIEMDFRNFGQLRPYLAKLGEVTVRNAGTDRAYLNLRLPGEAKGINLKDFPFMPSFLRLSTEEKVAQLEQAKQPDGLVSPGQPRPVRPELEKALAHWYVLRAREEKYLNPGNTRQWNDYHAMTKEEKLNFINKLETTFYSKAAARTAESIGPTPAVEPVAMDSAQNRVEEPTPFLLVSDSRLGHMVLNEVRAALDEVYRPRLSHAPVTIPAETLRRVLGTGPLELPEKYDDLMNKAASQGPLGIYGVLREHLHREPGQAWCTLVKMGLATHRDKFQFPAREASEYLWQTYLKKKAELTALEVRKRRAQFALLQMSLVLSRKLLWAQSQAPIDLEKTLPKPDLQNTISAAPGAPAGPRQSFEVADWTHLVDQTGSVQYHRKDVPVLRDEAERIVIQQEDFEAIEIALKLAILKFGKHLDAHGESDFLDKLVVTAARLNLGVRFANETMQAKLEALQGTRRTKQSPPTQQNKKTDAEWAY